LLPLTGGGGKGKRKKEGKKENSLYSSPNWKGVRLEGVKRIGRGRRREGMEEVS